MTTTTITLSTGDALEVASEFDDVAKTLENAARSSPGTLARLRDATSDAPLAVNPAHVVTIRANPAR